MGVHATTSNPQAERLKLMENTLARSPAGVGPGRPGVLLSHPQLVSGGVDPRCPLIVCPLACQQLSFFPRSISPTLSVLLGSSPNTPPAPHPGLQVCPQGTSGAPIPLPISSQAAQSDKGQDGHTLRPQNQRTGELWTSAGDSCRAPSASSRPGLAFHALT